jgi:DNA polymerase-1
VSICEGCPLACEQLPRIKAAGDLRTAKYLVVSGLPFVDNEEGGYGEQSHLSHASMTVFNRAMEEAGFSKDEFVFHAHVRCGHKPDTYSAKSRKAILEHCRHYLKAVVRQMKPVAIITLGAEAAKAVFGRPKKITKIRGQVEFSEEFMRPVYPMIDPFVVASYPQNWGVFRADALTLKRLADGDFHADAAKHSLVTGYEIVDDLQFLIDQNPSQLVVDVETDGLDWFDRSKQLLTIQLSPQPGVGYLLSWDHPERPAPRRVRRKLKQQLTHLLCSTDRSVIGFNLKFDLLWITTRLGIRFKIDHDVLLLAALHDENQRSKDLSTLTKIFVPELAGYDDWFNRKYDKAKMREVPLSDMLMYGAGDVDATFRLFQYLEPLVRRDAKLWRNYRIVTMPGINTLVSMELRGMHCDAAKLDSLETSLSTRVKEIETALLAQVPRPIKRAHVDKAKPHGLKFSRDSFVRDILFDHPSGFRLTPVLYTDSTKNLPADQRLASLSSKNHFPYFADTNEFVLQLIEYKKLKRLLDANIKKFREKYMREGMIHPSYSLHTTSTGRTSSQSPNSQNWPKRGTFAKEYRNIFVPPEGFAVVEADYSQIELRIVANMANEPEMVRIYREGGDIHTDTARFASRVTDEQFAAMSKDERALLRFKGKAINFGYVYGMGARKYKVYAKTQYGVDVTDQESEDIRNLYFRKYSGLVSWHQKMREFIRANGYVRSYSGRVRHLPMIRSAEQHVRSAAERMGINAPVQEFGSTLGLMAMTAIDQELDPAYMALASFVHDAIYVLTPLQHVEWAAKTLKYYMERMDLKALFDVDFKIPLIADVAVAVDGFGGVKELKALTLDDPYDFETQAGIEGLPAQYDPPNYGLRDLPSHLRWRIE